MSAQPKVKLPTAVSAGRDRRRGFRPKIRPTPPRGSSAVRINRPKFPLVFRTAEVPARSDTPTTRCASCKSKTNLRGYYTSTPPRHLPASMPPPLPRPLPSPSTFFDSLRSTDNSLRLTWGPSPAPPLNNNTPTVATDRLVCAPPCVCTALCMHRLVCGQPNLPCSSLFSGLGTVLAMFFFLKQRGTAPQTTYLKKKRKREEGVHTTSDT